MARQQGASRACRGFTGLAPGASGYLRARRVARPLRPLPPASSRHDPAVGGRNLRRRTGQRIADHHACSHGCGAWSVTRWERRARQNAFRCCWTPFGRDHWRWTFRSDSSCRPLRPARPGILGAGPGRSHPARRASLPPRTRRVRRWSTLRPVPAAGPIPAAPPAQRSDRRGRRTATAPLVGAPGSRDGPAPGRRPGGRAAGSGTPHRDRTDDTPGRPGGAACRRCSSACSAGSGHGPDRSRAGHACGPLRPVLPVPRLLRGDPSGAGGSGTPCCTSSTGPDRAWSEDILVLCPALDRFGP